MRYRSALVACMVGVFMLAAALPAAAQATNEPLTWLLNVTVKPGMYPDLEKAVQTYDKPVLDKLAADGVIGGWAFGCQVVGPPSVSCMYTITAADWAAMGKVEKAFEEYYKAMKPEAAKAAMGAYLSATQPDKESSSMVRHVVFKATPGAKPTYMWRGVYKIKPGKGPTVVKMFKEYDAPIYDKLLEAGVINGYGLAVPEVRTSADWTHAEWVTFSDMAQMDAITKAFEEARKAGGEALLEMFRTTWLGMLDPDSYWESVMHFSVVGAKEAK
jgi:hypothetical protein